MGEMIWVRCKPGRRVPLPDGREVPAAESADAAQVLRDIFIARRLADGDIEAVAAPAAEEATHA